MLAEGCILLFHGIRLSLPPFPFYGDTAACFVGGAGILWLARSARATGSNVLYPNLRWRWLPAMLGYALLGSLVAGVYGIIHDQVTYSISTEYFTRLKFSQFHYANFGFRPRVFVGEIGFLATW